MTRERREDPGRDLVDTGSEMSFPASDPPAYMGGAAVAGRPPEDGTARPPANETLSNPDAGETGDAPGEER